MVDEEFSMIASHVSGSMKKKIVDGKYIDLVKLLPQEEFGMGTSSSDFDQFVMEN